MRTTLLVIAGRWRAIVLLPEFGERGDVLGLISNQAEAAQRAADTRDADNDGIYCEALPCPCLKPGASAATAAATTTASTTQGGPASTSTAAELQPAVGDVDRTNPAGCKRPKSVQSLSFSATKFPRIYAHWVRATAKGWPKVMLLNRKSAAKRRSRLLADIPGRAGVARDEYPAAVGRGKAYGASRALTRGINPIGWRADVEYVPSGETARTDRRWTQSSSACATAPAFATRSPAPRATSCRRPDSGASAAVGQFRRRDEVGPQVLHELVVRQPVAAAQGAGLGGRQPGDRVIGHASVEADQDRPFGVGGCRSLARHERPPFRLGSSPTSPRQRRSPNDPCPAHATPLGGEGRAPSRSRCA